MAPDPSFLIMNQDTFSNLAEAYKILRTFIEFLLQQRTGGKVLLFTSTGPQEGKSITAANLAIAFAQAGRKTLLIDSDLRYESSRLAKEKMRKGSELSHYELRKIIQYRLISFLNEAEGADTSTKVERIEKYTTILLDEIKEAMEK